MDSSEYLKQRCRERAVKLNLPVEYEDRFDREFEVIEGKGFVDYFLILADIVDWAKSQKIEIGPSRGSAAGSLVSYLLGITQIDPIKYNLLFERFLDPNRDAFPDIDLDFQKSRRGEVLEYIKEKYGENHVCQIVNFVTFKPRQTIKDVCRIFDVPFQDVNRMTNLLSDKVKTLEEAMEIPEINSFFKKNPQMKRIAFALEGGIRQQSVHAAGMVITPGEISEYISIVKIKDSICSCFDKNGVEDLGLLKLDALGLRTLDVIATTKELIRQDPAPHGVGRGIGIDLPTEFDDPEVYNAMKEDGNLGCFQIETKGLSKLLKDLDVQDFETLYHVTALYRPGPLNSGQTKEYIRRSKDGDR